MIRIKHRRMWVVSILLLMIDWFDKGNCYKGALSLFITLITDLSVHGFFFEFLLIFLDISVQNLKILIFPHFSSLFRLFLVF